LLVLGDDVTTDQISPAGAIPQESQAGRYLIERGEDPHDLNVYASRRGNFEVMVRGLFTNRAVINHLAPGVEPGNGIDFETGQQVPLFELAERNRARGVDGVILAGERYGGGSSRDWAAKGTAMIGARAVIASSFERIHRTNLIGMGVLPLRAPSNIVTADLHIDPTTLIDIELSGAQLTKRCRFAVTLISPDREPVSFDAVAQIETDLEIELLLSGGFLPLILAKAQSDAPTAKEKAIPGN
jgi:aconitate hydratase